MIFPTQVSTGTRPHDVAEAHLRSLDGLRHRARLGLPADSQPEQVLRASYGCALQRQEVNNKESWYLYSFDIISKFQVGHYLIVLNLYSH